jgi:hypothetical protein
LLKDYKFLSKNLMTQVTVSVFSSWYLILHYLRYIEDWIFKLP